MAGNFLYEKDGAVTTLTFNRPERRNCLSPEVMDELEGLLRDVRNDSEVAAQGGDQDQAFRGRHLHRAALVLDVA